MKKVPFIIISSSFDLCNKKLESITDNNKLN